MCAVDITHYSIGTIKINCQQFDSHDLPVHFFFMTKAYNIDFMMRVLLVSN